MNISGKETATVTLNEIQGWQYPFVTQYHKYTFCTDKFVHPN